MHQKIVNKAFEKTKNRVRKESGVILSKTKCSEYLSTILLDEYDVIYGSKSLRDVSNNTSRINQPKVLEALCNFLEYNDYESYVKTHKEDVALNIVNNNEKKNDVNLFSKKTIIIGVFVVTLLITCFSVFSIKKQRWMVWKEDHYKEVSFDPNKYGIGKLKLYKEERILYFKKIEGTCEYAYFGDQGEVRVWYGKNFQGQLDLFNSVGLHPETGKTLKPITTYMIRKYVCSNY